MTIIEYMRQKLTEYPKISEFLTGDDIHIDFTEPDPVNYGLSSNGDSLVKEDILGNQIRRHNFIMYAVGQSFTDYNRLANSNFLLEAALANRPVPKGNCCMQWDSPLQITTGWQTAISFWNWPIG